MLGLPDPHIGVGIFNVLTDPFSIENGSASFYQKVYTEKKPLKREFLVDLSSIKNQWLTESKQFYINEYVFPVLDEENNELVFVAVVGERQRELTEYRIPADTGVAGWVNTHKKPALVQDVRKDDRWISAVDQSIGFHTRSLMAVPLLLDDRVLGVMEVVNTLSEDNFNRTDLVLLQLVARLASFVFGFTEDALEESPNQPPSNNLN